MIEAILNFFTDSLIPGSVIRWFRRRISYKHRIAKSRILANEDFLNCLSGLPQTIYEINNEVKVHNAKMLLLIAYPIIDNNRFWQCIGIDEKNKFLFELKFDVSGAAGFNLNENEMYCVIL